MQFSPQGGNGTVFAPSDVVPVTGIEPVRLSSRDFKSRASANSATPAKLAPRVGLEPTAYRLTAECSTIELPWNIGLLS